MTGSVLVAGQSDTRPQALLGAQCRLRAFCMQLGRWKNPCLAHCSNSFLSACCQAPPTGEAIEPVLPGGVGCGFEPEVTPGKPRSIVAISLAPAGKPRPAALAS